MPTYQYFCNKCEEQFDVSQSIKADPLKVCPKELCRMKKWGKGKVKKVIGAGAGLIFKGSGFYITDYRSEKYKEAAKKESSTSGSSDAKPAAGASSGESKAAPAKSDVKSKTDH